MTSIWVTGTFDNLQARDVRFLEEAARLGPLHVLLWNRQGTKFPLPERRYFLGALRCVRRVIEVAADPFLAGVPIVDSSVWVWPEWDASPERDAFCVRNNIPYRVLSCEQMAGFPAAEPCLARSGIKKVIVTGCFDYLHSGHVRFFEEASAYGDLYVVIGSDANVRLLKGEGHPLYSQEERRYLVGAIRFVCQALISTGSGWMDAAPEIERLRPDVYLVNEDGDKPEKRQFCLEQGLEYVVLQRNPAPGLPRRSSTNLRGF
ncbi:MAG: adenylyltransferase/cytidyltransferase family protein [Chloroflexota bacterium]